MASNDNSTKLQVKICKHDQVLYEGEAKSLTSHNSFGTFDIIPKHANFIALIDQKVVIRTEAGAEKSFDLDVGVVRCLANRLEVFLGIGSNTATAAAEASTQAPTQK